MLSLSEASNIMFASKTNLLRILIKRYREYYGADLYGELEAKGFNKRWIEKIISGTHGTHVRKRTRLAQILYEFDPELFVKVIREIKKRKNELNKLISLANN